MTGEGKRTDMGQNALRCADEPDSGGGFPDG
jgi:hypothetical protein